MRDAAKQREYRRKCYLNLDRERRKTWFAANGPCRKCGSWVNLELDHVNPEDKEDDSIWSWSNERREAELAKCQPLCHDCHKQKTALELSIRFTKFNHGSIYCYQKHKCRCNICVVSYKRYRHDRYILTGN